MLRDGETREPGRAITGRFRLFPVLAYLLVLSVILVSAYVVRSRPGAHRSGPNATADSPGSDPGTSEATGGGRPWNRGEAVARRMAELHAPPDDKPEGESPMRSSLREFIGPRGVPYAPHKAADTLNYAGVPGGRPEELEDDSTSLPAADPEEEAARVPPPPRNEARFKAVISSVSRVRNSGPVDAEWVDGAKKALASLSESVDTTIEMSDVECYAAGCLVRMRYPDMAAFRRASQQLFQDPRSLFNAWPGTRQRILPAPLATGEVVSGWILSPG
jgi:hypothetical protein